ncbi:hypothetical protein ACFLZP_03910 [Patescibacteria group bacterium]
MGKKRISVVNQEDKQNPKSRKVSKSGKDKGRLTDMGQVALEEAEIIAKKQQAGDQETQETSQDKTKKTLKKVTTHKRSARYLAARKKIDSQKTYSLQEALKLVKKTSLGKFNGSLECHLTLFKEKQSGSLNFPFPTGKEPRITIASDKLITQIKKGKIDFDCLVATPEMMAKLVPLAKILGPKGLMPNPKKGTIGKDPQQLVKKMTGQTSWATEKKAPLIHLVFGKVKQKNKELAENLAALFLSIGPKKIKKVVICACMGPAIKVDPDVKKAT